MVFQDDSGGLCAIDTIAKIDIHKHKVNIRGCIDRFHGIFACACGFDIITIFFKLHLLGHGEYRLILDKEDCFTFAC